MIVPAFAVGRTQELVYDLHQLAEANDIPELPIVIDSPLASRATAVFSRNADLFDESEVFVRTHGGARDDLFAFPLLRFTESVEDSKALNPASRSHGGHRRVRHGGVGSNPAPSQVRCE